MFYGFRFYSGPVTAIIIALVVAVTAAATHAAELSPVRPFESGDRREANNEIDRLVTAALRQNGLVPAPLCSDAVFIRRLYLDVLGTLPQPQETEKFLKDQRGDKRAGLIDSLLQRKEFAGYQTLRWCDLLRIKAEFPINLWPNAVQGYYRWIYDAVRKNLPYDQFARELLTGSGSCFRVPQVNFYRAIQGRGAAAVAGAAALTFMGTRLDKMTKSDRIGMEAFFSRVSYKSTAEWKEEIVYYNPVQSGPLRASFPGGPAVMIPPEQDPRAVFAAWLTAPGNPWFARNIVNRIWFRLFGRGIIHEPDDIRPDNPPANPPLLTFLEKELVNSGYDLRHIYRLILNSRTYQQSSVQCGNDAAAAALFAYYPVRRLDAETLLDAINSVTGGKESYTSAVPEPFAFIPETTRSIELEDGSITSQFLEMFGRPARDTGLESERSLQPSDAQRLYLLNSSHIQGNIERSSILREQLKSAGKDRRKLIEMIYLNILSRYPEPVELAAVEKYFQKGGLVPAQSANDLVWALINTKEFLYRH